MQEAAEALAAATAVALAFNAPANAEGLIENARALDRYSGTMLEKLSQIAQGAEKDRARLAARGFFVDFEKALGAPGEAAGFVAYPQNANPELLRVIAVIPPKGFASYNIPVCVQQNNQVLATLAISSKGEVTDMAWDGPTKGEIGPDGKLKAACGPFISTFRALFNQEVAKRNGTTPPAAAQGAPPIPPDKVSESSVSNRPAVAGLQR